jgi:hypothetical protein
VARPLRARFRAEDTGGRWSQRGRRTAESEAYFVVRAAEPGKNTKILLQLASNTYNAYNNWGGFSLYAYNGLAKNQGSRVSFDRPGGSQFGTWELPFVQWAERNGYELDYAVNSDLEFRPELLAHYRLVLSVGHDEYWSGPMRDHLEKFIADGGNVAFFSGNSVCWQVRSEDNGRALTCWKQNFSLDPVWKTGDLQTLSTAWSHYLLKRPENQLTGVGFLWGGYRQSHGQFMDEPAEYTVHRPEHWVFAGTDVKCGESAARTRSSATSVTVRAGVEGWPAVPDAPGRHAKNFHRARDLPRALASGRRGMVRALGKGPRGQRLPRCLHAGRHGVHERLDRLVARLARWRQDRGPGDAECVGPFVAVSIS